MRRYLRSHLKLLVILAIFMAVVIAIFVAYNIIFVNTSTKYGSRLDGIEDVKLTNDMKKEIKTNIESLEITNIVDVKTTGRIINVEAVVKDDVDSGKAKDIGGKVLEKITDEQKKYFDVQIFVKKESDDDKFPIIGYKHHAKDNITWTKDR